MNEEMKDAAHHVAESARDLAEKIGTLAKAAFGVAEDKARELAAQAEPYADKAAEKVKDFADQAEASFDKAKVAANHLILILRFAPMHPENAKLFRQGLIVGDDHATITKRAQVFAGEKGKTTHQSD